MVDLTLDELTKTMQEFRAKHGKPLKAIKVSRETLRLIEQIFPVYPCNEQPDTLYGVPLEIDNDLAPFECKPRLVA